MNAIYSNFINRIVDQVHRNFAILPLKKYYLFHKWHSDLLSYPSIQLLDNCLFGYFKSNIVTSPPVRSVDVSDFIVFLLF